MADNGGKLLFEGADWTFDTLRRTYDAIEVVAGRDLELDLYPSQIEIISSEQMLDVYSSAGMPAMYRHWSFGKHFIQQEHLYRKGSRGLAYEIVINSDPSICYCLEDNTMALQALVMAHAAFGHNHFFKCNHLFRQWTDPEGILDYLEYSRGFIRTCEERHGEVEVERLLDAAHALMSAGVFRYRRPPVPSLREELDLKHQRLEEEDRAVHYLWDRLVSSRKSSTTDSEIRERKRAMRLPEENLLFFVEKYSPVLKSWQREILRIVRNIAQYFYPQKQTQIMNEGCACFVHFFVLSRLHEEGRIDDGAMLEILHNHTDVLTQPDFDDPRFSGFNPYALGFAIMQDIRRICEKPTAEDRTWFPDIAGCSDWRSVLKDTWANYRDESFIQQFLSPNLMRRFHMFTLSDNAGEPFFTVDAIHDEGGYHAVRTALARSYDLSISEPDIQVVDVDLLGDRVLKLQHQSGNGVALDRRASERTIGLLRELWGYDVAIQS